MSQHDNETIREKVREGYGQIARQDTSCCGPGKSCCGGGNAQAVAEAVGYGAAELAALPDGANMGLSCGNPTALAELKPGEVVVDLGSGGGFDVFIAARKVGPTGKSIGIDMTADMIAKARKNILSFQEKNGLNNVEFRLGEIEHLPVADHSVDVIISNCVLNLSPDKPQVWREIARALKPGGRVAVSDLALLKPLPAEILGMVEALIGCVAGAILVDRIREMAEAAGLVDIVLSPKPAYIDAMADFKDPLYSSIIEHLPAGAKASDYITSLNVSARKPSRPSSSCGQPENKQPHQFYNPAVAELVAIGAAIAANCESCFTYHCDQATKRGVSREDIAKAVAMAKAVKEAPAKAILSLAAQIVGSESTEQEACAPPQGACCNSAGGYQSH